MLRQTETSVSGAFWGRKGYCLNLDSRDILVRYHGNPGLKAALKKWRCRPDSDLSVLISGYNRIRAIEKKGSFTQIGIGIYLIDF